MEPAEITKLFARLGGGDKAALDALTPQVYDELRRMARRYMQNERAERTIQATALVNEVWLRLVDTSGANWQDRVHFFAVSANIMRRILVDQARARGSAKRGADAAEFLGISPKSVMRDWKLAKVWLQKEMTMSGTITQGRLARIGPIDR